MYFAVEDLKLLDPEIMSVFMWIMGILFALLLGAIFIYLYRLFQERRKNKLVEKQKAEKDLWFDVHKSILHRGSNQVKIPENTLEYFVCKLVFKNPTVYQSDWDVLQAAGEEDKKDRAVYFAVDRINNKARRALKLEDKLLKRSKEHTRLNDNYF